jgi:hypothetical protein
MVENIRLSALVEPRLKAEIERRAVDNRSQGEVVRNLLWAGLEAEELQDRLERREDRIEQLHEELRRRSDVEEKVDTLARREDEPDAPFFVEWYRWFRS